MTRRGKSRKGDLVDQKGSPVLGKTKETFKSMKKQRTECGTWADLPEDILRVIKSKLCLSDQVSFSAVCKSWRLFGKPILPMTYFWCERTKAAQDSGINFACELYDQCGRRIRNTVYRTSEEVEGWPSRYYYYCPKICASKEGWLLIVDVKDPTGFAIFCNPFSNNVIPLPRLRHQIDVATFSTIPTSPNCIIFVLYCSWGKTHLGTYRIGDKNWNSLIVAEREEAPEAVGVVYIGGVLYYVFQDGMLGCYSLVEQYWTILTETFPEQYSLCDMKYFHLAESQGQILLATLEVGSKWHLFRFDQSQMTWIAEKSLGGQTLFASTTSFVAPTVGEKVDLPDCIFYFDHESRDPMVYSFKDQRLMEHDFEPDEHFTEVNDNVEVVQWTVWIEPPNI